MLTEDAARAWLARMGPLHLYAYPDGVEPLEVELPDGRRTTDVPCDVAVRPVSLPAGTAVYVLAFARPNGRPAAHACRPMTMQAGDTVTIAEHELLGALE